MYKVIACDLDGTLLKDDKSISERTREALKRITDRGVIFLPSTGRTHRELPDALKDLNFCIMHYAATAEQFMTMQRINISMKIQYLLNWQWKFLNIQKIFRFTKQL